MRKCPSCEKGNIIEVEDIILDIVRYTSILKGYRCIKCKEEFPYQDETQKFITILNS